MGSTTQRRQCPPCAHSEGPFLVVSGGLKDQNTTYSVIFHAPRKDTKVSTRPLLAAAACPSSISVLVRSLSKHVSGRYCFSDVVSRLRNFFAYGALRARRQSSQCDEWYDWWWASFRRVTFLLSSNLVKLLQKIKIWSHAVRYFLPKSILRAGKSNLWWSYGRQA